MKSSLKLNRDVTEGLQEQKSLELVDVLKLKRFYIKVHFSKMSLSKVLEDQ